MTRLFKYCCLIATFCALILGAGCVTKTDMETLQVERQNDLNRIKQLEAELEESKQLLKDEIERSQSPVRQKAADMWAELQSLRADFARLQGQVELLELRMDRQVGDSNSTMTLFTLNEQLDEIGFILENQLNVDMSKVRKERAATLAAAAAASVLPTDVNATSAEDAAPQDAEDIQQPQDTDPAKALYDKAYALYREGEYEKARSYWAEFTDTFKGHPYSASAFFWQGQCYYKLKDYARAVILFEDVIEKYKKSSKYKSALLKAGYSWDYLGKPELAKMRMDEIIADFPKSVEATQAKRFLEKRK